MMVLCLALTACGQKSDTSGINSSKPGSSVVEVEPMPDDGGPTISDDSVEIPTTNSEFAPNESGDYRHEVGGCVFYTKHDLNTWVSGDIFDFYGMVDYFGYTMRQEYSTEEDVCIAIGETERGSLWLCLKDDGDAVEYHSFVGQFGGGDSFVVKYDNGSKSNYKTVKTKSTNMYVSYELMEIFLYTLERVDENPNYIVNDLRSLGLPSYVLIGN